MPRRPYNKFSWNEHTNITLLRSPIGTGFSCSHDESKMDTLADMAADVYAFHALFVTRFSQYAAARFHLAAEMGWPLWSTSR
ncbi:uncharacterized protein LAESUDRAFT_439669 [Laetiporus sulphureus 93-53]|uniref:Uncharacterized protein n=1 Tax=Laetiporus sulphureus 93-53 TaxID=1314785 RepID=A0A165C1X0_9APHY|nr:uncharacterized protein LAESUDRAFT_439669 [Laetiporus sulphureus 93-53]KZT02053.1 hypothetical protein LAESUDRAFT_439669 [Laetiporus sulphureus 93-53]